MSGITVGSLIFVVLMVLLVLGYCVCFPAGLAL